MNTRVFTQALPWQRSRDAEFPFELHTQGQHWQIRLNDFPAEAMYTLIIDQQPIVDFDDWPRAWSRPK